MTEHHVTVAKAAHVLGIDRHELQHMIRNGDLHAFEGLVDLSELRQRFPSLVLEEDPVFAEVQLIRAAAFGRRVRETVTPDSDELEHRLKRRSRDLAVERGRADHLRSVFDDLSTMLTQMQQEADPMRRQVAMTINRWLLERLEAGPRR